MTVTKAMNHQCTLQAVSVILLGACAANDAPYPSSPSARVANSYCILGILLIKKGLNCISNHPEFPAVCLYLHFLCIALMYIPLTVNWKIQRDELEWSKEDCIRQCSHIMLNMWLRIKACMLYARASYKKRFHICRNYLQV